jgi:hypothetical protein
MASTAMAQDAYVSPTEYHPDISQPPYEAHRWLGFQFDLGLPSGTALGLVVRPKVEWLRLNLAGTYNTASPGARVGLTLDPVPFGIAPTLTLEGGFAGTGSPVFVGSKVPAVGYEYVNFHAGLEFGKRNKWRLFIHAGPTYTHVTTSDFNKAVNVQNLVLANPTANLWVVSTGDLGVTVYF